MWNASTKIVRFSMWAEIYAWLLLFGAGGFSATVIIGKDENAENRTETESELSFDKFHQKTCKANRVFPACFIPSSLPHNNGKQFPNKAFPTGRKYSKGNKTGVGKMDSGEG
uniref:Uncharacterized protein n=1 Tax=Anopheles farauti TaxID=69004 RepID=A0A182QZ74_9DIPT